MQTFINTIAVAILLIGCQSELKKKKIEDGQLTKVLKPEANEIKISQQDSTDKDTVYNEYLHKKLNPIQKHFKCVNRITQWATIDTVQLNQSTEGGEARYYYLNERLLKIVAVNYGEMGRVIQEFYPINDILLFVLEKRYEYRRPLGWDGQNVKNDKDTQVFNSENNTVVVDRSYFENGVLIHQENNMDCGAPFTQYYSEEEQKRLNTTFKNLLQKIDKQ